MRIQDLFGGWGDLDKGAKQGGLGGSGLCPIPDLDENPLFCHKSLSSLVLNFQPINRKEISFFNFLETFFINSLFFFLSIKK